MDQLENTSTAFDLSSFSFLDSLKNVDYTFFIYIIIAILFVLFLAYLYFYNSYYNKEIRHDNIVDNNDINDIQREVEAEKPEEQEEPE
jgi:uncharacterized membrane protein